LGLEPFWEELDGGDKEANDPLRAKREKDYLRKREKAL